MRRDILMMCLDKESASRSGLRPGFVPLVASDISTVRF